ncbi:hypothetical protein HED60_15540 [Planctomycetales bacterium ZRK34]|nr:hypothetical protein HED60_15540 [Planctomycetales bacterium ZRK34]
MHKLKPSPGPRPTISTVRHERMILLCSIITWGLLTGSPVMRPGTADDTELAAQVIAPTNHVPRIDSDDDHEMILPIITAVPTD